MTNTTTTTNAATIATDAAVAKTLDSACKDATSADRKARDAAAAAVKAAGTAHGLARGVLNNAILAAYGPHLGVKSVRDSFSAALVLLIADVPVTIAADSIAENKAGNLTFKSPAVLGKDERAGEEQITRTLSAADTVAKVSTNVLKAAATVARAALGTAKPAESKGGRPGKVTVTKGTRAPFADELVAQLADTAGFLRLQDMLRPHGYMLTAIEQPAAPAVSAETPKAKGKGK
jgi:hypothetical protein